MTVPKPVAGTVMVTNQKGETFFLVHEHDEKLSFVYTTYTGISHSQSPLGSIMDVLGEVTLLNPDSLRLMEMTQLKGNGISMPLIVFDMVETPDDPSVYLKETAGLSWRRSKELTELMAYCDFDGVPVYE